MTWILVSRILEYKFVDHSDPGEWETFTKLSFPIEFGLIGTCCVLAWISLAIHIFSKKDRQVNP
jgi:hypothetical protein